MAGCATAHNKEKVTTEAEERVIKAAIEFVSSSVDFEFEDEILNAVLEYLKENNSVN